METEGCGMTFAEQALCAPLLCPRPRKLRSPCFPIRETLDYSAARPCSTKSHGGDDFEKRARLTKSKILSLSSFSVSPCLPTFRGCVLRQYYTPLTFIVNYQLSLLPLPMIIITIIYTNLAPPGFLGATRP